MAVIIALCYLVAVVLLFIAAFVSVPYPRLVVLAGAFALLAFSIQSIAAVVHA